MGLVAIRRFRAKALNHAVTHTLRFLVLRTIFSQILLKSQPYNQPQVVIFTHLWQIIVLYFAISIFFYIFVANYNDYETIYHWQKKGIRRIESTL